MTTTAPGRGHAAAGAGVRGLVLPTLVLATTVACAPPQGRQLCEAIAKRNVQGVHAALERGFIDLQKPQEGCTPVEAVFAKAKPDDGKLTEIGVELILGGLPAHASWDEGPERRRVTAVETAARNGNAKLVRALLAVGLRVQDPDSIHALHLAAGAGHLDVVKMLVAEGVDPAAELAGRTPAAAAQEQGREEVEIFLLDELAAREAVAEAAKRAGDAAAAAQAADPAAASGDAPAPPQP